MVAVDPTPSATLARFARAMGPAEGPAEVLLSRRGTTPLFAAMVNAAASHFAEQDDIHNGSVFHPGAVVFPPALAVAQALGSSGRDLLTAVVVANDLAPERIARVTAHVHRAAIDVLGPVTAPATVHQAKFSMGTVLAMIARYRRAGLQEFEQHFGDPDVAAFRDRVRMVRDAGVEAAYPQRWVGKVEVETIDGRVLAARVDEPKGDPGNTLTRAEIEAKAIRLAEFGGAATAAEVHAAAATIFALADVPHIGRLLAGSSTMTTPAPTRATT